MPIPAHKAWSGLALDRVNAVLTSATAASATSLPLTQTTGTTGTLTTSGSSYSAIIIDGVNTEVVACSGNFTAGAIAVGATANAHPAGTYVTFQLTASIGPTAYLPLEKMSPKDDYARLLDQSFRGSNVSDISVVQGMRSSAWDLEGDVIADTIGYILGGFFGAEDFSSGTPNTHKFSVLNNTSGNFQATPITLYFYDGYNTRIFAGGKITDAHLSFAQGELIKWTAKFIGRASGVVSNPTPSFTSLKPLPAWTASMTVGGTATYNVQSFEIDLSHESSEAVPGLTGVQDPVALWQGPVKATGKIGFWKVDDTMYAHWQNEDTPTIVLNSTQGSGTTTALNVQMTNCDVFNAEIDVHGKPYVVESFDFEAMPNTTDATTAGGGLTPCQVVLKNAISSSVYV